MKDEHITHIREKEVFLHKKSNNPYHAKQSWVKKDTFQRPKIFQLQECIHWSGGLCLCIELFTAFVNASVTPGVGHKGRYVIEDFSVLLKIDASGLNAVEKAFIKKFSVKIKLKCLFPYK